MLKKWLFISLFFVANALVSFGHADEASVKTAMESRIGGKVTSVTKTAHLGLYEVYVEGQILYTDETVSVIINGSLIDGKSLRNITEERLQKLLAIKFSDLPLNQAIKIVRGNGKRILATFEDPNCGFCKRLSKSMADTTDVTWYVFLFPILTADSLEKSKQIWCSPDRAKAWHDWMLEGKAPSARGNCDVRIIQKNLEFGKKLNITGTPTLFFANGERVSGAIPVEEIEKHWSQANTK